MSNDNYKTINVYVYVDDMGEIKVSSFPFKSTEKQGYSLVHQETVVITLPKFNKREHQINALKIRASLLDDNAKNKQVKLYEQIHKLGESDE